MKRMFIALGIIILALFLAVVIFLNQKKFGRMPQGVRLERIHQSPNYRGGAFQNQSSAHMSMGEPLKNTKTDVQTRPSELISVTKTDLKSAARDENFAVWFGHSSYLIQADGVRILVDPVFCTASPVSFVNRPFEHSEKYTPDDMPDIDFLIITHDHWDHLDYETVRQLRSRTSHIICPLGVGEHFEFWGFDTTKITEFDWYEAADFENATITCRPAMHFSGRGLKRNQTLWASFVVETEGHTFYIGGDSGYGTHFAEVGRDFEIDVAFVENGQYNEAWSGIHTLPKYLDAIADDLQARYIITVHHSKYALARHAWDEPLQNAVNLQKKHPNVLLPTIGEKIEF